MSARGNIFALLYRTALPDAPSGFLDVLTSAAETALHKSRIDAERFAAARSSSYWTRLLEQVEQDGKDGLVPFCEVIDRQSLLLQSSSSTFIKSTKRKDQNLGELLRARHLILSAIDGMSARQYEALGCLASRYIGSIREHVTPPGNEGGIDFLATIRVTSPCHIFSALGRELRLIGQSKKYASKVEPGAIDQFIKTVENVRHRSSRVERAIPAWFHASSGPIIGWITAHSGFQTGARDEAKKHGIILSDSRDFAEILSLTTKFHGKLPPQDRANILSRDATAILTEFGY